MERDNDWQSRRWQGEGRVVRSSDPKHRPKHEQEGGGGGASAAPSLDDVDLAGNRGKHCESCHMLDFLPVLCGGCRGTFCASCGPVAEHSCPAAQKQLGRVIPECPLCSEPVSVKAGQDANRAVELHIRGGCAPPRTTHHSCSYKSCQKREAVAINCRSCSHNFCIKHRAPLSHKCGQARPKQKAAKRPPATSTPATAAPAAVSAPAAKPPPTQVAEGGFSAVEQLVAMMGPCCDRAAAAAALRMCGGDVQAAALQLLDGEAARQTRAGREHGQGRAVRSPA
jgi:hypothetical protein